MLSSTAPASQKRRSLKAPAVEITDIALKILQAFHRYRLLEWRQIVDLFGSSLRDTNDLAKLVQQLYQNTYLEEVPRLRYHSDAIKDPVYRLGTAGAQLLSGQLSIPFPAFHYWGKRDDRKREQTKVTSIFIDHSIELSDARITFERSAAYNHCTIETWRDETELQRGRDWSRVEIVTSLGSREIAPVLPDSDFVIVSAQGRSYFLYECDRGTESISRRWQRKILGYKEFVLSREFHMRYGITGSSTPLRILTTTPSLARAQNLKTAAETYGAPEVAPLFLFTPLSELMKHDALTSPIWLRGGFTDFQSIL